MNKHLLLEICYFLFVLVLKQQILYLLAACAKEASGSVGHVLTKQHCGPLVVGVPCLFVFCFFFTGESSRALLESFSEELKLKQTIQEELAHTWSSDLCMVYLSCWLHQPFVPPDTRLSLEALLLETGHRPL